MEYFWQLSGPESQVTRIWTGGKRGGNASIARQVFADLSRKREDGSNGVDLVLGIETSGASHVLLPSRGPRLALNWRGNAQPYSASKYASLSPIHVDTDIRLQALLDDRQKVSKATKAGKEKGDNSKANGKFWNGPPNTARAAFEHGRCFWRILRGELHPQIYGLPYAGWHRSVHLFSLAMNFWTPDGVKLTNMLLDASLTRVSIHSIRKEDKPENQTWYFRAEENHGLQNSDEAEKFVVPEAWNSVTIPQADIGAKIQGILAAHSRPKADPPAPLVLLVYDYVRVKDYLESLGIVTSEWKYELKDLIGFDTLDRNRRPGRLSAAEDTKPDFGHASSSRVRSRSPRGRTPLASRETRSPSPSRRYAPVYVVDVVEAFKTVTGSGDHPRNLRPTTVFNRLTCNSERDDWCAGSDSRYTMESWITMVKGLSIDEQGAFYRERSRSEVSWPAQPNAAGSEHTGSEAPEAIGLFQQQATSVDLFNDGADLDDDWY